MRQVNIHEAKTHLSKLIQEAPNGQEVIIAKGNRPLVTLKPLPGVMHKRRLGGAKGKIRMAEDFNAPLDEFEDYMK